jgi:hypothetical protein
MYLYIEAWIAQVIWGLVMVWMAKRLQLESLKGKDFLFSLCFNAGSGAHPASYPVSIWGFHRGKSDRGVKLTTHPQLVTKSRIRGSERPLPHVSLWHTV